jgi:hypothetical protein
VLARNADGTFGGPDVPLLTTIRTETVLRNVHLIDATVLRQVRAGQLRSPAESSNAGGIVSSFGA